MDSIILASKSAIRKKILEDLSNEGLLVKEENIKNAIPDLEEDFVELRKAYEAIEDFDHKDFFDGAKIAFETIINAFNSGDKKTLKNLNFNNISTQWINHEAMSLITSFGKNTYLDKNFESNTIEVNSIHNPVLYKYYLKGNWDLY